MDEENPNLEYQNGAAAPAPPSAEANLTRLQQILDQFEITIAEANDLVLLEDYDVVVIADDSGSMTGSSVPPQMRTLGTPSKSRWDELKETVTSISDIAACFQPEGVDIHFLNRPSATKVKGSTDPAFASCFQDPPRGRTPLTETIRRITAESKARERKLLLFILTDGEPNNGPKPCIDAIVELTYKGNVKVQIMVCTPDDQEVAWLNALDEKLASVDVTDDYFTERAEVLKTGLATKFTRGDWVMKAMLGPISSKFDQMDEKTGKAKEVTHESSPACCVIA